MLNKKFKGIIKMTLDQLKPGEKGRIKRIRAKGLLDRRLSGLGLYPGIEISVVRNAPLKDPMEIEIQGNFLSIRRQEAGFVETEEL